MIITSTSTSTTNSGNIISPLPPESPYRHPPLLRIANQNASTTPAP
jgi:hypothetical protein